MAQTNNKTTTTISINDDDDDIEYNMNKHNKIVNEFYNDDFYDYKDTFLNRNNNNNNNRQQEQNLDDDEDEDEYNDDFGPLSTRRIQSNDDDLNDDDQFDLDENNEQDMLMMDTFFKRVDSCDLNQKPNKAKIINNYLIGELLGDGSYGKVKECLDLSSLSRRAVKIINLKMISRKIPRGVENVRKEINIMKRLNHKNLIKLYDTFEKSGQQQQQQQQQETTADELLATSAKMINLDKPPKLYIFMDYCMTSLEKLLKNAPDQRLCNWQAQHYMKQLMNGLDYLHSINIIHNDIKPGNLLINCDDILKICDFSISAELNLFYEYEYINNNNKQVLHCNEDNDNW